MIRSRLLVPQLVFGCLLACSHVTTAQDIGDFVDTERCYASMLQADENVDMKISRDEYALYSQYMVPEDEELQLADNFEELPLALQMSFSTLACLCTELGGDDTCCEGPDAHIDASGVYASNPTPEQQSYLFLVCSLTSQAIGRVLESDPPTSTPSQSPTTQAPTITLPPTPSTFVLPVITEYEIGIILEGATPGDYDRDLEAAMDSLAPQVLAETLGSRRLQRQLLYHRNLQSVELGTTIDSFVDVDCPEDLMADLDIFKCQLVAATINLQFDASDADAADGIADQFELQLNEAIAEGQLQDFLFLANSDPAVLILDDTVRSNVDDDGGGSRTISGGGVAGIVVGSMVGVGLLLAMLAASRRPQEEEDNEAKPVEAIQPVSKEDERDLEQELQDANKMLGVPVTPTTPDYGKGQDAMVDNDDHAAASVGSSSNAGSSGWSSSAGISSLNTASQDGLSAEHVDAAAAAAGLAPRVLKATPEEDVPAVSRADLDSAIEAGDWAAVGATAALLAAASDSQSYSSQSQTRSGTRSTADASASVDAARAAELDNLVDAGDWEGVVLAAAKYEAESGGGGSSASRSGSAASLSASKEATMDSSSMTSGGSKAKKRQELRAIVEDLVQRVVPEEIQNVDEMMLQFRGREEELIETLRTMEERAVAQKARSGAQKAAKLEAKQQVKQTRAVGAAALSSTAAAAAPPTKEAKASDGSFPATASRSLGTGQITSSKVQSGKESGGPKSKSLGVGVFEGVVPAGAAATSERERKQSALEMAIEQGDWEAVGEAAAMLSDHSLASSADTDEINRLAEGLSSAGSVDSRNTGNLSDRAEELDKMIEKGDWAGVASAAENYGKATKSSSDPDAKKKKEAEEEARRQRRLKHLKEEEDALAQAEIWMAISEQAKQDSQQEDEGAREAADWAIGRSLQALVQAEQTGNLNDSRSHVSEDASKKKGDDDDDEEEV